MAKTYEELKEKARAEAIDWSYEQAIFNYSYEEIFAMQTRFEKLGKKYGLLKEFRENAII